MNAIGTRYLANTTIDTINEQCAELCLRMDLYGQVNLAVTYNCVSFYAEYQAIEDYTNYFAYACNLYICLEVALIYRNNGLFNSSSFNPNVQIATEYPSFIYQYIIPISLANVLRLINPPAWLAECPGLYPYC